MWMPRSRPESSAFRMSVARRDGDADKDRLQITVAGTTGTVRSNCRQG